MTGLKQTLKEQGRQQVWLAERLGVTPQTVYRWTTGKSSPDDPTKLRISKLLGVSVKKLFFDHLEVD